MLCSICHETPIDPKRDWQLVKGWVTKREGGGANTIALREPVPDVWACMHCITAMKAGRAPMQTSLLA